MLQQDNLDDLTFQEIVDRARESIQNYYPEWTDQNVHDPGIMLMELLAWLVEMQQFYLNQIEDAAAALPLLGLTREHTAPATVYVRIMPETEGQGGPSGIPRGTPLLAEDVPFESASSFVYGGASVTAVTTCEGHWEASEVTVLYPFGRAPQVGNRFSVYYDTPQEHGRPHSLEISIREGSPKRNPVDRNRPPRLAQVEWEYLSEAGYVPLTVRDGTYGFITGGVLLFVPDQPMAAVDDGRYEIRGTLTAHQYDLPPAIEALQPAVFHVIQRETLCEDVLIESRENTLVPATYLAETGDSMLFCETAGEYLRIPRFTKNSVPDQVFSRFTVEAEDLPPGELTPGETRRYHLLSWGRLAQTARMLGYADGFPNQRYRVDTRGDRIIYEDFSLLVGDSYEFLRARKWLKVDNFHRSRPMDLHYTLDEESGEICFGDGIRGAMPKGVLLVASMSLTRGAEGNIAPRQLKEIRFGGYRLALDQPAPAQGGRRRERVEETIARTGARQERAVTAEDYEKLVRQTPGLIIDEVHAYAAATDVADPWAPYRVMIAVKPPAAHQRLSAVYRQQIREHLEPFRLAGCEVEIISPIYVAIDLIADIGIHPYRHGLAPVFANHLQEFFRQTYGGFGARVERGTLLAELAALPYVERVYSLELRARGGRIRYSDRGDIILPPDALANWGRFDLLIR